MTKIQLKQLVTSNVDRRLVENDFVKVAQILDPMTKNILPKDVSQELLAKMMRIVADKGIIDEERLDGTPADSDTTGIHSRRFPRRKYFFREPQYRNPCWSASSARDGDSNHNTDEPVPVGLTYVEFYLYPTVSTALIHSVKPELTE